MDWLFREMLDPKPALFYSFPKWKNPGQEAFDGVLMKDTLLVPMEYKGGFLSQEGKYSGELDTLVGELEKKVVTGCKQLACKIGLLFDAKPADRRELDEISVDHVERVLPVLIVQDHSLRGLFINWWLNRRFQELMGAYKLRPGIHVLPLNVLNVQEVESMVESSNLGQFDPIYALHHRAVRDPEMADQNFFFMFGGYGQRGSTKMRELHDRCSGELLSYIFPSGGLARSHRAA